MLPKSFPGPSWCMSSAEHSSQQRRDGPSIRIGATTRSGPNKLARVFAALCGAPEGWVRRVGIQKSGPLVSFRVPPTNSVSHTGRYEGIRPFCVLNVSTTLQKPVLEFKLGFLAFGLVG
jgi:hypothetical protein